MTFKKIVEALIEQEVYNELRKLTDSQDYVYIDTYPPTFEHEKDMFMWECCVNINHKSFVVGGTVDPMCGICVSCMRDENHKYVWFWVEETRRSLGITEFKI